MLAGGNCSVVLVGACTGSRPQRWIGVATVPGQEVARAQVAGEGNNLKILEFEWRNKTCFAEAAALDLCST